MDDTEMWSMQATEPVFGMHIGQTVLANVHSSDKCAGRHCCLHNPSDHHMVDWELLFRADKYMMERICPTHGIGHPDPDDMEYHKMQGNDGKGVHNCCGCCHV